MRIAPMILLGLASLVRAESAEEMLSACKGFGDAKVTNGNVSLPRDFESGQCWGAFGAIRSAMNRIILPDTKPSFGVCLPLESTRTQLVTIFAEYLRRNPQLLSEDYFGVAWKSLIETFPCVNKAPSK